MSTFDNVGMTRIAGCMKQAPVPYHVADSCTALAESPDAALAATEMYGGLPSFCVSWSFPASSKTTLFESSYSA
jgi:hypothetical protein